MNALGDTVLQDPAAEKIFHSGTEVFLVGGYLRDLFRGVPSRDLDFVLRGKVKSFVSGIVSDLGGTIIEFREGLSVRVVTGGRVLDFTELKSSLPDDLRRRDFTMNAIAWSPETGIVDPLNGVADIKKCTIRAVSAENLVDDPVRLLRAYRFSAELGWAIEGKTRTLIRKLKHHIAASASERITLEVFRLLAAGGWLGAMKSAFADHLLPEILTIDDKLLRNNLKALSRLDSFLKKLPEGWRAQLGGDFSQELSFEGLLRAEQLLFGADIDTSKLSLSTAVRRRLGATTMALAAYADQEDRNDSFMFDLFSGAGQAAEDIALLTRSLKNLRRVRRFLQIRTVLSAGEIMETAAIGQGPLLGRLLHDLRRMQYLGRIRGRRQAKEWLRRRTG